MVDMEITDGDPAGAPWVLTLALRRIEDVFAGRLSLVAALVRPIRLCDDSAFNLTVIN
jgi:hypothetical protein